MPPEKHLPEKPKNWGSEQHMTASTQVYSLLYFGPLPLTRFRISSSRLPVISLPGIRSSGLANKNIELPFKFEFQINNEYIF